MQNFLSQPLRSYVADRHNTSSSIDVDESAAIDRERYASDEVCLVRS
jgi:hypothetical protein